MNPDRYLQLARSTAALSKLTDWSIGAVLVKGGKVLSTGYNRYSAQAEWLATCYGLDLYSLHAEMDAITQAPPGSLQGATLFVSGFKSKNGNPISCRPCKKCWRIIEHVGIAWVYWATKNGYSCWRSSQ